MKFFKSKRFIYSLILTFFLFPVLVPAGTIAAIPMPNIMLIYFSLFPMNLGDYFSWIFNLWLLHVPSFLITFLIVYLISHVVVYRNRHAYKWKSK